MVGDVVFHLGDCKTGSTSIQRVLAQKAWQADGISMLYSTGGNHIPTAKTLTQKKEFKFRGLRFGQLNRHLTKSRADYAVVSAEHFEFTDPSVLSDAVQTYLPKFAGKIRYIAYVRPHAERLMSSFAEQSKNGQIHHSVEDLHRLYQENGRLFYTPRFEKWRRVFGDMFTVRPMIRDRLYKQDVVTDFFHYLLEGKPFKITNDTAANVSLSLEDLVMIREMRRHIRKNSTGLGKPLQVFGRHFGRVLASQRAVEGTKLRLHKALAEDVVQVYREDAIALDAGFFEGTPMSDMLETAVTKAINKPQSFLARDHYNAREMRRILAVADMMQRLMEADPRFFTQAAKGPKQRVGILGQKPQLPWWWRLHKFVPESILNGFSGR